MDTVTLPRVLAFAFIASCWLFAHQQPTTPSPATNAPAQQPMNRDEPAQQPTSQPQASEPRQQPAAAPEASQSPKEEAWQILDAACTGDKTSDRATAIRVLGLMPNDPKPLVQTKEPADAA